MASLGTKTIRHKFSGGWSSDFGPNIDATPGEDNSIDIPFLVDAENVLFELDGGPHKIGGTSKVNSTVMESGATVSGLYDYWRQGSTGAPVRRRIVHVGTKILADIDNGAFTQTLFTGLRSGAVPNYATFDDRLIISSDSDVPKTWDQATVSDLGGTPPRFSFCVVHKNRVFAAGDFSAPSRLYYSVLLNPQDWIGAGSGSIDIDPSDGDMITGIASHRDDLFVFKGPNKGAIHRITGSSPTGGDAFARKPFVNGLGACWQNAIFRYGDELGFVSQYGTVHNLQATQAFGDFQDVALSRPINKWINQNLNFSNLRSIWAVNSPTEGRVYFTVPTNASSTNNNVLVMDYRRFQKFGIMAWSLIPDYSFQSLNLFVDQSGYRRVLGGAKDGFVKRLNMPARSLDNASPTAYTAKMTSPFINYGLPIHMKTISEASIGVAPSGNYNATFKWTRDNNSQQSQSISLLGLDVLGASSSNQFTLGASVLGGVGYSDRFMSLEDGGEFRAIQYQVTQGGLNQDLELHSLTATVKAGSTSLEN
jgi:hypothetical protein